MWDDFDVVSQLDAAVASGDAERQKDHILAMLEAITDSTIPNSPLFSDVKLGGVSHEDKTAADTMAEILDLLKQYPDITRERLAREVGLSVRGVEKNLAQLKSAGKIIRVGGRKGGHWEVVEG